MRNMYSLVVVRKSTAWVLNAAEASRPPSISGTKPLNWFYEKKGLL